jgi:TPR repeat protein
MIRWLFPLLLLTACASARGPASANPTSILPPGLGGEKPPQISPAQIRKAEALRAEGMTLLFSKDPAVKNEEGAKHRFEEAAALGDPVSMDQLGGFYSTGLAGTKKSCEKAIEWFEKSSRAGYPLALNNLAYTLATCPEKNLRDAGRAEDLITFLFKANPNILALLDTYAAVLAEEGSFPQAAKTMAVVADLAELTDENPQRIDEMKEAMRLYQKKKTLAQGHEASPETFHASKSKQGGKKK